MRNIYMDRYITNTIDYLKTFEGSLRMAALQDDGQIDREEQRIIDRANKLTDKYILPAAFDPRVGPAVASAVAQAARDSGVARI